MGKPVLLILFSLILASISVAADTNTVGYIYRSSNKIDYNIEATFEEMGLVVGYVDADIITSYDLTDYLLLFINDEHFSNADEIPVNDNPSLIMNTYDLSEWGWAGYASTISRSQPLHARALDPHHPITDGFAHDFQVYTVCCDGAKNLPMNYLSKSTRASQLDNIVSPTTDLLNSVIATVEPGTMLRYGNVANAREAFYGIGESEFWTSDSEELFKNTVRWIVDEQDVPSISKILEQPLGETQTRITWDTDILASTRVSYGLDPSMSNSYETNLLEVSHDALLTGLLPGRMYYYQVTSCNINEECSSSSIGQFWTEDLTEPIITNDQIITQPGDPNVVFRWDTDDPGDSEVKIWEDGGIVFTRYNSDLLTSHDLTITADPLVVFNYNITSCNHDGLCTTEEGDQFILIVGFDNVPPDIESVEHTDLLFDKNHRLEDVGFNITAQLSDDVSLDSVEFEIFNSGGIKVCDTSCFTYFESGLDMLPRPLTIETATERVGFDSHLTDSTYSVMITATDENSNIAQHEMTGITVYNYLDVTDPVISDIQIMDITNQTARVTWETDDPADSVVDSPGGVMASAVTYSTGHDLVLQGLEDRTEFEITVSSCNDDGLCKTSSTHQFTTLANEDNDPPVISLDSPAEGFISPTDTVDLYYTVSDYNTIDSCSLNVNGMIVDTDYSVVLDTIQSFSHGLSEVYNTWSVTCVDTESNVGSSVVRSIERGVAPTIDDVDAPSTVEEGESYTVSFIATDQNSDILAYLIYEDDVLVATGTSWTTIKDYEESGTYTYKFVAEDSLGLYEESSADVVVTDKLNIVVNEFYPEDDTVELFNPLSVPIDLAGWTLNSQPISGEIISSGYLVFDFPGMSSAGGQFILIDDFGILVDSVAYGNFDDGDTLDNAQAPPFNRSAGRVQDGNDSDNDASDFVVLPRPTIGRENNRSVDEDNDGYDFTTDCDETDPSVNPGQPEVYYNGIDDDCNSATIDDDQDSDGHVYTVDCDDTDDSVYPGSVEILDDIDQNCVNDAPVLLQNIPPQEWEEDSSVTLDLSGYFQDPDGDALSFTGTASNHFTASFLDNTTVKIESDENFHGSGEFYATASDYGLSTDSNDADLTVIPVNDAPEITSTAVLDATEDSLYNYQVIVDDVENDPITYTLTAKPAEMSIDTSGLIGWTSENDDVGTHLVTVHAEDIHGAFDEQSYSVEVTNVNDAPTLLQNIPDQIWDEDTVHTLDLSLYYEDVDAGDILNYTVVAPLPLNIDESLVGSIVTFTPEPEWSGIETITFMATDGFYETFSNLVTLDVTPVNDIPELDVPYQTMAEDSVLNIPLGPYTHDADGDSISYYVVSMESSVDCEIIGDHLLLTPVENFNGLADCTIVATDSITNSTPDTVTINVTPVNDAPDYQQIPNQTWEEDAVHVIDLSNFYSDIDGDVLTFNITTYPTNVDSELTGSIVTLTPEPDWTGIEHIEFMGTDGLFEVFSGLIALNITPVNDDPEITSDPVLDAVEDSLYAYQVIATDADGDSLNFSLETSPAGMTINAGLIQWTPENADVGSNPVTVNVKDGKGGLDEQSFDVVVENVNDAPTLLQNIPDQVWEEDNSHTLDIALYFEDVDAGDALEYSLVPALPVNIQTIIVGSLVTFTPEPDWSGIETITFSVNDTSGASVMSNTVLLNVTPANDDPTMSNIPHQTLAEDTNADVGLTGYSDDPDGDHLSYEITFEDTVDCIITGDILTINPAENYYGDDKCTVRAFDGTGYSNEIDVGITVTPVDDSPVLLKEIHPQIWAEDTTHSLDLMDYFKEIDGESMHFSYTHPENISIVLSGTTALFIPTDGWHGTNWIIFTAIDANGSSTDSNNASLIVEPVNDPPVLGHLNPVVKTEGELVQVIPTATDIDGDSLEFSFGSPLNESGAWQTGYSDAGTYHATVTVYDGNGGEDSGSVAIIINEFGNHPPVIDPISDLVRTEGDFIKIIPTATDLDGDALAFGFSSPLDSNGEWQTDFMDAGLHEITVTVSDGTVSAITKFNITILEAGNQPPVLEHIDDIFEVEGALVKIVPVVSDPDGDNLTISFTSPLDANGEWQTGFTDEGKYTSTVSVTDGTHLVSQSVMITVWESGNHNPVIDDIADIVLFEDQVAKVIPIATDPDGDTLWFEYEAPLDHNGEWKTTFKDAGEYLLTVNVYDGEGGGDSTKVKIIVLEIGNHGPVIDHISDISVWEGELVEVNPTGSDPDGDDLTFIFPAPLDADGRWQTTFKDSGVYPMTVEVTDGQLSDYASFTLTVRETGNHAPILHVDESVTVIEGEIACISATADDPDGDSVTISFSSPFDTNCWLTTELDIGSHEVIVSATDGSLSVSDKVIVYVLETPYEGIGIKRLQVMDEFVLPGELMETFVTIQNSGNTDMKNVRLTAVVPELGIRKGFGSFNLGVGKEVTRVIPMEIPYWAWPGDYSVRYTFSTDKIRRVKHRDFTIE